ncbi:Proteinase inhibitor I25 [Macleaya cordata]|uniref:Cysteine proteinase inhibitor n=1 Tax=Macleaya cordata TaxID=56857 RepID=A0A200QMT9_MACCD|nr:Proteinase inhibitor I25 [Macleaya cordata]
MANVLGGIRDSEGSQNSLEIESLAKFAVEEHNKKQNALLEFGRVVKAKEQVVSGTLHHLTLEVIDAGKKKIYEAQVWVKPWLNSKELKEFKHADDATASDHGDNQGEIIILRTHNYYGELGSFQVYFSMHNKTEVSDNETAFRAAV